MALPPQLGQFDDIVSAGVAQAQGAKVGSERVAKRAQQAAR